MKTKIPPPILALIMIAIIYLSSFIVETFTFSYQTVLGVLVVVIGLGCAVPSFRLFAKNKTTISPFTPSETTALVTSGMYRYSRNPMYLGMALILLSISFKFNLIGGIFFTLLFAIYITRFQIIPEEAVMEKLFGDDFQKYKSKTRMWI